jgi:hypothetical protein
MEILWGTLHLPPVDDTVDFANEVLIVFTVPDDPCPAQFLGLLVDGDTLSPNLADGSSDCKLSLVPRSYVLTIERSSLDKSSIFVLPAFEPSYSEIRLSLAF